MNFRSHMLSYPGSKYDVQAYLARPDTTETRPAIVVYHEIFGLVDHVKDVANRFAAKGYVALAPDLFSSDPEMRKLLKPEHIMMGMEFLRKIPNEKRGDSEFIQSELAKLPNKRSSIIQGVTGKLFDDTFRASLLKEAVKAVEYIDQQSYVEKGKVGVIGFCFGGGISFRVACETRTAATVVFYGENPSPLEKVQSIQSPVLGIYGGEDMRINSTLDKLVSSMVNFKKDFQMKLFPGAPHAFFNDTNPATYRKEAASVAWDITLSFFERTLKGV
ncbi:MAG: dienelactone hydrolase family protein [Nitrososphaerota archaeon]|nr:dienelactone hydrolase family protein [Nitrososphaerota archaeon]